MNKEEQEDSSSDTPTTSSEPPTSKPPVLKIIKNTDYSAMSRDDLIQKIRNLEKHLMGLRKHYARQEVDGDEGRKGRKRKVKAAREFDFMKYNTRHVALWVAYLGWDYLGYY